VRPDEQHHDHLVGIVRAEVPGALDIRCAERQEDPRGYRVSFEKITTRRGFVTTRTVRDGVREAIEVIAGGVIADFEHPFYRS